MNESEHFVKVRLVDLYDALVWNNFVAKKRLRELAISEHEAWKLKEGLPS
jgi:hypothetical protein